MKELKSKDLREKSVAELEELILETQKTLYNYRRDLVFRKVTDTTAIKVHRHNIARMTTLIGEKKRGEVN
jgi:large subunit ribosomal protein L29